MRPSSSSSPRVPSHPYPCVRSFRVLSIVLMALVPASVSMAAPAPLGKASFRAIQRERSFRELAASGMRGAAIARAFTGVKRAAPGAETLSPASGPRVLEPIRYARAIVEIEKASWVRRPGDSAPKVNVRRVCRRDVTLPVYDLRELMSGDWDLEDSVVECETALAGGGHATVFVYNHLSIVQDASPQGTSVAIKEMGSSMLMNVRPAGSSDTFSLFGGSNFASTRSLDLRDLTLRISNTQVGVAQAAGSVVRTPGRGATPRPGRQGSGAVVDQEGAGAASDPGTPAQPAPGQGSPSNGPSDTFTVHVEYIDE